MNARDRKSRIVNEALDGIRQIKFTATEEGWEKRILQERKKELVAQWQKQIAGVIMSCLWVSVPALIGAAALSVYALLNDRMDASIAFTSLAVFSSLEWTFGALPSTITEMLDAMVSAKRIEEHLAAPERSHFSYGADTIEFRQADIAWPANTREEDEFVLRNIDLRFPQDQLR